MNENVYIYGHGGVNKEYLKTRDDLVAINVLVDINENATLPTQLRSVDDNLTQLTSSLFLIENTSLSRLSQVSLENGSRMYDVLKVLEYEDGCLQIPLKTIYAEFVVERDLIMVFLNSRLKNYQINEGICENMYVIIFADNADPINIANELVEMKLCSHAIPDFVRVMKKNNFQHPTTSADVQQSIDDFQMTMPQICCSQWGLKNTGQYGGIAGRDVNLEEAWELTQGSPDIKIAVIDEGVDLMHVALQDNLLEGYDATDGKAFGYMGGCDVGDGHGTACAGIIASTGKGNTGIGGATPIGIAPNCKIIPIRVAYTLGTGYWITQDSWVSSGITFASNKGADILNCSFGGGSYSFFIAQTIKYYIKDGRSGLGGICVCAAGNNDGAITFPANLYLPTDSTSTRVISVGAMTLTGNRKTKTSIDTEKNWASNYGGYVGGIPTFLSLVAPGVLIPTTDVSGDGGYNPKIRIHQLAGGTISIGEFPSQNFTIYFNGTSAACPHVVGVIALMLSANKKLRESDVYKLVTMTARLFDLYPESHNDQTGYGCVDAGKAVKYALLSDVQIKGPSIISYPVEDEASYILEKPIFTEYAIWSVTDGLEIKSSKNDREIIVVVVGEDFGSRKIMCDILGFKLETQIFVGLPPIVAIGGNTNLSISKGTDAITEVYYVLCDYALDSRNDILCYYWDIYKNGSFLYSISTYEDSLELRFERGHEYYEDEYLISCYVLSELSGLRGEAAVSEVHVTKIDR